MLYDERRVWADLLAGQPLASNLLVPLRLGPGLAAAFPRRLLPDLGLEAVLGFGFEHTPGRRDPRYLGDATALDALVTYRTRHGRRGFVALELKYAEPVLAAGPISTPRLDELALASGNCGGSTCSPGCCRATRATTRAASCCSSPG